MKVKTTFVAALAIVLSLNFATVFCSEESEENDLNSPEAGPNCICDDEEALFHKFVRNIIDNNGPEGKAEFLKNFRPKHVCGSDREVYSNECAFLCARQKTPDLQAKPLRNCRPRSRARSNKRKDMNTQKLQRTIQVNADEQQDAQPEQPPKSENYHVCLCPRHYFPVCGSDGKTYGNLCTFECARDNVNSELTIVSSGACNDRENLA